MKKLEVRLTNHQYDIIIEDDLLCRLSFYIKEVYHGDKIFIVTDETVASIYLDKIKLELQKTFDISCVKIRAGEESKCLECYADVCSNLLDLGIRRNHLLLALGGGVVGDLTGFVASTLYRGIPYISVPTTLLSQIDSSIGGKTGIDFHGKKNIIGAFKQPLRVLIDPQTLKTLEKEELNNGMGELIKHACIGDKELLEKLQQHPAINEEIILQSLIVKKKVVELDEFDQKERMSLNFGHTFGHIIEMKYHYRHGEAVAIGMLMASKLGIDLGITSTKVFEVLEDILKGYELPTICYPYEDFLKEVIYDKKNLAGTVNFIFVSNLGEYIIYQIDEKEIQRLGDTCESSNKEK